MKIKITFIAALLTIFACSSNNSKSDSNMFFQLSEKIVQETESTLRKELTNVMQTEGVEAALKYCNVNALSITDSLSKEYKVGITRIAKRNRNPYNKLKEEDRKPYEILEHQVAEGGENRFDPHLEKDKHKVTVYQPIIMQSNCSKCHGVPDSTMPTAHVEYINKYYPNDKATGFKTGDLRGAWKLTFRKNK